MRIRAHTEFENLRPKESRKQVVDFVSSKFGISKSTVYQWYRGITPIGGRAGRIARIPELLYVLGALLGDGCVYHWRNHFQVWLVGEQAFAAKFALKLSYCLGRQVRYYKYGSKNAWFVRVDNAELYFLFQSIRRNRSLIRRIVNEIDAEHGWSQFIEGLFDAEGCVKIIGGRERKTPKACLDLCNTDFGLLNMAREVLREQMGIGSGLSSQKAIPPRVAIFHLRIYSKEGVAKFLSMIRTTKLTEAKRPLVEAWLTKRR